MSVSTLQVNGRFEITILRHTSRNSVANIFMFSTRWELVEEPPLLNDRRKYLQIKKKTGTLG